MRIEIRRKLFWYCRIVSSNGQIVFTSETYFSKSNALRAGKRAAKLLKLKLDV